MKSGDRLRLFVGVIVLVVLLGVAFNFSTDGLINNWIVPLGISFFFSGIIGEMIEKSGGAFLKNISATIPIGKFNLSISAFFILVIVIKFWLFK